MELLLSYWHLNQTLKVSNKFLYVVGQVLLGEQTCLQICLVNIFVFFSVSAATSRMPG